MNIFLSYSSSERELAERLAYSLRDESYSVFFDRASLPPSESYDSRIRNAIEGSDLFIFLISPKSIEEGSYALTELEFAKNKWKKPSGHILPVLASGVDFETLPPYLDAVTVLQPEGDPVAEVLAVVSQIRHLRRRIQASWIIVALLILFAFAAVFYQCPYKLQIPQLSPRTLNAEPIKVISSLSNSGWAFTLDIIEDNPIQEIFYKFSDGDAFTSTGFSGLRDRRSGQPKPRPYVEVPLFREKRTLFVKYTDSAGHEHGPYMVVLDPIKLIVAETKEILDITRSSWISFREYPKGKLFLYFTHLLAYKNALKDIQYSIGNESLSNHVQFKPDWTGPGAPGLNNDETYVEIPMSAQFVEVKLFFIDGSDWPASRFKVAVNQ